MSDKIVYALNVVSGMVAQVPRSVLDHPTFSANLVEVDAPDECVDCGVQPDEVVTTDGLALNTNKGAKAKPFIKETK